jgi:glycosyltransferase involved in cell wall biosynthesis
MHPLLSIIIPLYKVEDYIEECLHSIFNSAATADLFEVIIVNDGSPDRSMEIALGITEGRNNVKTIDQKNQGLSAARMNGLEKADGDYVWFIDSDDYLKAGAVDTMIDHITSFRDVDVFVVPVYWHFEDSNDDYTDIRIDDEFENTGSVLLKSKQIPCWMAIRFIMKRDLFQNKYLFFPKGLLHEDIYFCPVLSYFAQKVRILDKAQYVYRKRPDSIMTARNIRSSYDILKIYSLLKEFYTQAVHHDDKPWFQEEMVRVLLDSYKVNKAIYPTREFHEFKKRNLSFILHEYKRFRKVRSFPRQILDLFMFVAPRYYQKLMGN